MSFLRKYFLFFVLIACTVFTVSIARAQSVEDKIKEYEKKLTDIRQQKNTLSTQIQEMDTQMYLTGLTIQRSEQKIVATQSEIEKLSSRIDNLDSSLAVLSKLLLRQIAKSYKTRSVSLVELLFETKDMNDLANKVKYLRSSQNNNQKLLVQVQEAKSSYEEQKVVREQKKQELDQLIVSLNSQKVALKNQQMQKQKLLVDTNNDETVYQNLLAQARAQLSAFSTFFQSSGANSVIEPDGLGKGADGNYFSQRDKRWAYNIIGNSRTDCGYPGHPCTVLEAGCLLSSIAMTLKSKGVNITPLDIATNLSNFDGNTALMSLALPGLGNRVKIYSASQGFGSLSDVDSQLNQGYVIAGINYGPCQYNSDHFVVLTKKEGNEYKMYDPIHGPDINFSSHYSQICWAEVLR